MNVSGGSFNDYDDGAIVDGGSFRDEPASRLELMRQFIAGYPYFNVLGSLSIDYTDQVPDMGGIFPQGLVEVSRTTDLLGNVTTTNQLNFALYTVFEKAPGEDEGATLNAEWQMGFQEWVQERSVMGFAPTFGDVPAQEVITAQDGQIYSADAEGVAIYAIQISVTYIKKFRRRYG